uniref:SsuA/THI5-like domain-containing protein n=1 Tax=Arsenophonus endosymbiont of Trialeurodes vaporariorum TaxID=235567 RepID=A0A3B0M4E6_9GAMM
MKKFIYTVVSIVIVLFISDHYLGSIKGADSNNPLQKQIACSKFLCDIVDFGAHWIAEHGIKTERVYMDNAVNILHAVNDGSVDAALGVHGKVFSLF